MEPLNEKSQIAQEYDLLLADARQQILILIQVTTFFLYRFLPIGIGNRYSSMVDIELEMIVIAYRFID